MIKIILSVLFIGLGARIAFAETCPAGYQHACAWEESGQHCFCYSEGSKPISDPTTPTTTPSVDSGPIGSCISSSNCPGGFQCIHNSCTAGAWPNGGCTFSSDCPIGYQCSKNSCVFETSPNGCNSATSCPMGYQCLNHSCVAGTGIGGSCHSNFDCPTHAICKNGKCSAN